MANHIIGTHDLSATTLTTLLERASFFLNSTPGSQRNLLQNRYVTNLFFEDSTRTKVSFEVAERNLGATVVPFDTDKSSLNKKESFYDTLKTLESIGISLAVIRHSDDHLLEQLAKSVNISLINAGAGKNEHPTQSLLDLLTIQQEFKTLKNLKVAIIGDIKHSRVAKSNLHSLTKMGSEVWFAGPEHLLPTKNEFSSPFEIKHIDHAVKNADVVMMLRVQFERHQEQSVEKTTYLDRFGLSLARAKTMKEKSIIMHPAPINRGVEIDEQLIEGPQSRIFKQMSNGVYARMACLEYCLSR